MGSDDTVYLITHEDGTERKITVPSAWKVTFGPAARGANKAGGGANYKVPLALRFYENETKQRAIFTDVVSFRDLSIKIEVKRKSVQEKHGFMEYEGQRKATTFQATTEEWINPDEIKEVPQLPKVEDFEVNFSDSDQEY